MIKHLGSTHPLTDVTYVFDEPTAGLHPHDIERMNRLLVQLRDKGNTVFVVEHEPETIRIADHVVDVGPGAGSAGGRIVFEGTVEELRAADTVTGTHFDDRAAREGRGALGDRRAGDPRCHDEQSEKRRRRHSDGRAGGAHGRGGLREELARDGAARGP